MADILIVEDEPSILNSLEFILQHAGWKTASVSDGAQVAESIQAHSPRAVVLDVMLPGKSGFEVLRDLRANEATKKLPVLILTAKGQQQDIRTATELGADAFVTKPYANSEVVETVRDIMVSDDFPELKDSQNSE